MAHGFPSAVDPWHPKTSEELGTPDGDRLNVLVSRIDRYESEHFPIDAQDPV
jgi:HTH-type transcriptional regulator/antitoxin HigA